MTRNSWAHLRGGHPGDQRRRELRLAGLLLRCRFHCPAINVTMGGPASPAACRATRAGQQIGRPQSRLPAAPPRGRRGARPVGRLGQTLPHPGLREAAKEHRRPPVIDPRSDRTRPVQRTDRVRQPEDPTHHQNRLRLHLPPRSHRPRHAQPRRAPPCPARPNLTHTSVRRAHFAADRSGAGEPARAARLGHRSLRRGFGGDRRLLASHQRP